MTTTSRCVAAVTLACAAASAFDCRCSAASSFARCRSAAAAAFACAALRASARSLSRCALFFGPSFAAPSPDDAAAAAFAACASAFSLASRFSSGSSSTTAASFSASSSRYSSNSPWKTFTSPPSITQISLHTALMSDMLCVMTITPPLKLRSAVTRQSTVSRSRWLVGSSSSRRCERCIPNSTKTTRDFCPPERVAISCSWWCPSSPKRPSMSRTCW
mmetsp:Transcript_49149/g.122142  ORF Transcript_49149/g.122142 Transcript_49149/m.122142 type:complete len:218 (-) Transcript_49149:1498-2151(-)